MSTAAEVKILFTGDTSNLEGATQKANGMFDGMLGGLTKFGAIAGVGALAAGAFGAAATMAAADVAESQNKVNVVFGESKGAIEELADTAAASLGQTRGQVLEAAGTFGNLLTALGMTKDGAADMSVDMVKLASDLASFNNSDPTEVLEALRSGLTGEAEPMKRFGVALNEVAMKQAAVKAGLGDNVAALSEAEKMQLRYNIIMEQTKTAQGDFANTSDGMANSLRIIKASLSDAVAEIGDRFLPLIQPLVSGFAQALPGALDMASGALDKVMGLFDPVAEAFGRFQELMASSGDWASGPMEALLGSIEMALGGEGLGILQNFGDAFDDAFKNVRGIVDEFMGGFQKALGGGSNPVEAFIRGLANIGGDETPSWIVGIIKGVRGLVDGFNNARPGVESFIGSMVDNFNTMKENIGPIIDSILPVVGEAIASLGDGFAIVAPIIGDLMAVIGDLSSKLAEFLWPILQQVFGFINDHKELFVVLGATIAVIAGGPVTMLVGALVLIGAVWPAIVDGFNAFKDKLAEVGENVSAFIDGITGRWEEIKADTAEAWDNVKQAVDDGIQGAYDAVESIGQAIQDKIGEAQDWIRDKINEVWNAIPEDIREDLELIAETIREKFDKFKSDIETTLSAIVLIGQAKWTEFRLKVEEALAAVRDFISTTMEGAKQRLDEVASALAAPFVAAFEQIKQAWETHVTPIIDRARQVFENVKAAVKEKIDAAITALKDALGRGKSAAEQEAGKIKDGLLKPLQDAIAKVKAIAGDIINGLVGGLNGAKDKVAETLLDMVRGGLDAVKSFLGIASPSKAFEEIGMWITLGLASGIQKEDQKAIAALAAVIQSMNSVIGGVQDFASKLLKFVVPSDTQLAEAKGKYVQMLVIIQNFAKDMSYLGSLVGPSTPNISFAAPGQIATINQGLAELASTLPAVKELQGLRAEDLLTGGEASWVTGLTDIIGKVAASWGSLADNLTKMSAAKMPSAEAIQTLKESAVRIIVWAQDVTKLAPPNPVGLDDFAQTVKSAADMLATVAKVDLSRIAAITVDQLSVAQWNIRLIGTLVQSLVADWMTIGTDARGKWVEGVTQFSQAVKANADILRAGDVGDMSEQTTLTVAHVGVARTNIQLMGTLVQSLVTEWMKVGTDARDKWTDGVKSFADAVKANLDILKASQVGEVKSEIIVNLDAMRAVLLFVRDELVPAIQGIVDGWTIAAADTEKITQRMADFAGWIKVAVDIAKATEVGELKSGILVTMDYLVAILEWMRDTFAPAMEAIAAGWQRTKDAAELATDHMKRFADWIKAAVDIAKISQVGELESHVLVNMTVLEGILVWMRDKFAPLMESIAAAWIVSAEEAKATTERMKLFGDWIKAAIDIAKVTQVGELQSNILVNMTYLEGILVWMRDTFVPAIQGIVGGWNMATEEAKDLLARMTLFASIMKAASDIAKSASDGLSVAAGITGGDLTKQAAALTAYITMVFDVFTKVGETISTEQAKAAAILATAAGTVAGGAGDIAEGINKLMSMATGGLFGADASRGDIGFMQRVRGRRADFNASVLTDSIKRMVAALTAALADLTLPSPEDPRIKAIAALGDAFSQLADGIGKLATVKIPDAKRMAELMAIAAQGSLIPGAGLTVATGGGGTTTINNYNTVNGGVTIVAPDQPSFTSLIAGLGAWRIR